MRSLTFGALLLAVLALAASTAHAGSVSLSPGGPITVHKSQMIITHFQLTVSRYPLWIDIDERTCDVDLAGVAHAGPTPDGSPMIELTSGSTSNCSLPADVTFARGAWLLDGASARPDRGSMRNVQVSMTVAGVTCDYEFDRPGWTVMGRLSTTPVLVGSSLVTTFGTSSWSYLINPYLYSTPKTATCGAIRIDIDNGPQWEISPGQTITAIP